MQFPLNSHKNEYEHEKAIVYRRMCKGWTWENINATFAAPRLYVMASSA